MKGWLRQLIKNSLRFRASFLLAPLTTLTNLLFIKEERKERKKGWYQTTKDNCTKDRVPIPCISLFLPTKNRIYICIKRFVPTDTIVPSPALINASFLWLRNSYATTPNPVFIKLELVFSSRFSICIFAEVRGGGGEARAGPHFQ